jgi:hypothetical protein
MFMLRVAQSAICHREITLATSWAVASFARKKKNDEMRGMRSIVLLEF